MTIFKNYLSLSVTLCVIRLWYIFHTIVLRPILIIVMLHFSGFLTHLLHFLLHHSYISKFNAPKCIKLFILLELYLSKSWLGFSGNRGLGVFCCIFYDFPDNYYLKNSYTEFLLYFLTWRFVRSFHKLTVIKSRFIPFIRFDCYTVFFKVFWIGINQKLNHGNSSNLLFWRL